MPKLSSLSTLALAILLAAAPAALAAQPADRGTTPGLGYGKGGSRPTVGVPGPVAGVGLPILAVAGGIVWVLARKRRGDRSAR